MSDSPRPDDEDLRALVADLSRTLERLQTHLGEEPGSRTRQRGDTVDRPAPPSPRELVRFTESYTIPTLVSLLETGIQSLELLQATLRVVDGRPVGSDRGRRTATTTGRIEDVGRVTLDRLDDLLLDLQRAIEGGEPTDDPSRELLADARRLRAEIDDRLEEATEPRGSGHEIPVSSAGEEAEAEEDPDEGVTVDVEAELETIRRDVATEDRAGEDADETDEE